MAAEQGNGSVGVGVARGRMADGLGGSQGYGSGSIVDVPLIRPTHPSQAEAEQSLPEKGTGWTTEADLAGAPVRRITRGDQKEMLPPLGEQSVSSVSDLL